MQFAPIARVLLTGAGCALLARGAVAQSCFQPPQLYACGTQPFLVQAGDMNGDGFPDLVLTNDTGAPVAHGYVQVLVNQGNGTFVAGQDYLAGPSYGPIVLADLDGDGDLDVATPSTDGLRVFLNSGTGTLAAPVFYSYGPPWTLYVGGICAADLDGDGDVDLAVAHMSGGAALVYHNQGNGTFAPYTSVPAGAQAWKIVAGDFDADGKMDLATASFSTNLVTFVHNIGGGSFAPPVSYPVGGSPQGIVAADFDGDGTLDLATANLAPQTISLFYNPAGTGAFLAAQAHPAAGYLKQPHAADLDLDGRMDIVVARESDNNFGFDVAYNRGAAGFDSVAYPSGGTETTETACADFDGDGRSDIAFVSQVSNCAVVVLNCTVQWSSFCFGDGSVAPCPCGNSGLAGRGCENSAATGGAVLSAWGGASLALDTLSLHASGELASASSVFLQGSASVAPVAFGDGLRCVGGALKRLYLHAASGGATAAPLAGDLSISARSAALGDPLGAGSTRHYQVYYRDGQVAFCAPPQGNGWNVGAGVSLTWSP